MTHPTLGWPSTLRGGGDRREQDGPLNDASLRSDLAMLEILGQPPCQPCFARPCVPAAMPSARSASTASRSTSYRRAISPGRVARRPGVPHILETLRLQSQLRALRRAADDLRFRACDDLVTRTRRTNFLRVNRAVASSGQACRGVEGKGEKAPRGLSRQAERYYQDDLGS